MAFPTPAPTSWIPREWWCRGTSKTITASASRPPTYWCGSLATWRRRRRGRCRANRSASPPPPACRCHAADFEALAPQAFELGEPLLDSLDGPSGGAQVDIVDDGAGFINGHHVGGHRSDVDAQVSRNGVVAGRRRIGPDAVAQEHHILHRERRGVFDALFAFVLVQAVDVAQRAFARHVGFQIS